MADSYGGMGEADSKDEFKSSPEGKYNRWIAELETSRKDKEHWVNDVKKIIERYRDDRKMDTAAYKRAKYNILWSNLDTLKPALYSKTPKPQVERRFKDSDPLGRAAAQILERACEYSVQAETFDPVMKAVRNDWLLSGLGTAWIRYETYFNQVPKRIYPDATDDAEKLIHEYVQAGREIKYEGTRAYFESDDDFEEELGFEEVFVDHVRWDRFHFSPASCWEEVRWVAKEVEMSKEELKDRFGEKAKDISLEGYSDEHYESSFTDEPKELFKKARVFEIWDKEKKKVTWICKGHKEILDEIDDPLNLRGFFPCPRPLCATQTSETFLPIPDYKMYEDQARELDNLTGRIELILQAVRVAGVYNARYQNEGLGRMVQEKAENTLVPLNDWMSFAEDGGLEGVMDFMPLEPMVNSLRELYQAREIIKKDLYEITGLSDIFRGQTHPRETASAQQIKGQFATLRLQDRQAEMQRFARDCVALIGEVISEHFAPQTLYLMSGTGMIDDPNPKQLFDKAVSLLRNDTLRTFQIDIETDSTLEIDRIEEKRSRGEFLSALSQAVERMTPMVQSSPELAPAFFEGIKFFIRGHKAGRNLESAIEASMAQFQQKIANPAPPPPDPRLEKIKADMQKFQQEHQLKIEESKTDQSETFNKLELEREELAIERERLELEREKLEIERLKVGAINTQESKAGSSGSSGSHRSVINVIAPPRRKTITLDNGRTGILEEEALPVDVVKRPTDWTIEGGFYTDENGNRKIALVKRGGNEKTGQEVTTVDGGFYTDENGERRIQLVEKVDDGVSDMRESVTDVPISGGETGLDIQ